MVTRSELSGAQVEALIERLMVKLSAILPETQPEVAAQLVTLIEDPDAGPADFAGVIMHDSALCGRLLRAANSALFAQRNPVTTVERACMLLGLQRIRAITLGFYLSKSAAAGPEDLSRQIWGESVYRACLAAALGQKIAPSRTAEAFLIGLMMDTGIPLLRELAGPAYGAILEENLSLHKRMEQETKRLPCTHVDVIVAMCRLWDLPEALCKPIQRHHIRPPEKEIRNDLDSLHRVAYIVGGIDLTITEDSIEPSELSPNASAILGLDTSSLAKCVNETIGEYQTLIGVFGEVADAIPNLDSLRDITHQRLAEAAEDVARSAYSSERINEPEMFDFSSGRIRIDAENQANATAILIDSQGEQIVAYQFDPSCETPGTVLEALGLDIGSEESMIELGAYLRRLAA